MKILSLLPWAAVFALAAYLTADVFFNNQHSHEKDYKAITQARQHFENSLELIRLNREDSWTELWKATVYRDNMFGINYQPWHDRLQQARLLADSSLQHIAQLQQQDKDTRELTHYLQQYRQQWQATDSFFVVPPSSDLSPGRPEIDRLLFTMARYEVLSREDSLMAQFNTLNDFLWKPHYAMMSHSITPVVEEGQYYEAQMALQVRDTPLEIKSINGRPVSFEGKPLLFEHRGKEGINKIEIPVTVRGVYGKQNLLIKKSYLRQ